MSQVDRKYLFIFMYLSLLVLVAVPPILSTYRFLVTPDRWLVVNEVYVFDTVVGKSPRMRVSRDIKTDFRADWIAEVHRRGSSGFHVVCTARGGNDYRVDNALPDNLDLDWWTYPTQCDLPPGDYQVETLWIIHPEGYPEKLVRSLTNVFTVRPG